MSRLFPRLGLAGVALVALWESWASLFPPRISDLDVRSAAQAVRAAHKPGELIAVSPAWLSPLIQRELGDLMPVEHLGRADGKRFAGITEIFLSPHHAADVDGLHSDGELRFGLLRVRHYTQTPATVSYDLSAHFLDATVSQIPLAGTAPESPCLWTGALPTPLPAPGSLGGFVCSVGRVERRTMEIDYQPRRGIVSELAQGQKTLLRFSIPDADYSGSTLHLWLGLHDYHQRKQAVGPVDVVVDVDDGSARHSLQVQVGQGFVLHKLPLPAKSGDVHHLRIELSAASAPHHLLGLHGELRR
ncbi:MAG TPA: hypothetical protein PKI49_06690 [Pseudomonadota bacterium]|nr:hypothetical protein [Pseudomonadota bacterium]HNO68178.1 hypothetical protein [Pseudomonadota bacterium]